MKSRDQLLLEQAYEQILEEGKLTNWATGLGLGAAALFGGMGKAKGAEPSPQDFAKPGTQMTQSVKKIDQLKMKSPAMKAVVLDLLSGPDGAGAESFLNGLSPEDEASITPKSNSESSIDMAVMKAQLLMKAKGGKASGAGLQVKTGGGGSGSSGGELKRPSQAKEIPEP
jgi:hypothetical protein